MRDINRIQPIMNEVTKFWMNHPDYRFGQMISNLFGELCSVDKDINDIWFPEDNRWLSLLKRVNEDK